MKVNVAKRKEIPQGTEKAFDVGSRCIAIFNISGSFYALDDTCPHKGASLARGSLGDKDVACPLHNAVFSLENGQGLAGPCGSGVTSYPVTVEGDNILVEVPV